jgi:hypothetical protein
MKSHCLLVIGLAMSSVCSATEPSPWWSLQEQLSFKGDNGSPTPATVLTVDPRFSTIRIVSVPFEMKRANLPVEASLRTYAEAIPSVDQRYRRKQWIAISGGFSSFRVDVPLGLLIVDGKVYSTLSTEKAAASASTVPGEFGQLRWSGVLCDLTDTGRWDIIPAARYRPNLCRQALQAGPVPVAPESIVAISANEPRKGSGYERSVVCLAADGKVRFILVPAKTHLLPLAQWISKGPADGGLGCRCALNLAGDTSAGIAIRSGPDARPRFLGDGSFPIPSAFVIEAK